MDFKDYIQTRWVLWSVVLAFIVLKLPHLPYAFYWDEAWPYASAVKNMYQSGASLSPAAIDAELSRGHPLLFHFAMVCWMKLFGTSNIAMHSFPLFVTVLFIIAVYEVALRIFNVRTAIAALLLVAFQQMFFVQASFVLPEVLLAFLAFVSLWCYVNNRFVLTSVLLTLLFYTKESGLVLGLVLGVDAVFRLFGNKETTKEKWIRIAALIVPAILTGLFFLWQQKVRGWYVFPGHTGLIHTQWQPIYDQFRACTKVYFRDDFRKYFYLLAVLLIVVTAIYRKQYKLLLPLIVLPITVLLCSDVYHGILPRSVNVIAWVILYPLSVHYVCKHIRFQNKHTGYRFVMLSAYLIVCFSLFSAINFLSVRYLIIALVPSLLIAAAYTVCCINLLQPKLYYPLLLCMLMIEGYAYMKNTALSDVTIGAFDGLYVQQASVDFLEQNNWQDRQISVYENLQMLRLKDFNTGFSKKKKPYKTVIWGVDPHTEIVLLENIENARAADSSAKLRLDTSFKIVFRAEKGTAWCEVMERKR